jgi:hypothetical protein
VLLLLTDMVLKQAALVYFFYDGVLKHPEESGVFYTGLSLQHWNFLLLAIVPGLYIYWYA